MSVDLLLAVCVMILAAGLVLITHQTISRLHGEIRKSRFLHESVEDEAREWEKKTLAYAVENTELRTELDERENELDERDKLKPIRENEAVAYDFDLEVMGQGDPLWELVRECRNLMPQWEIKSPGIAAQLPHRRYSEFAQFIGNLCDEHRNIAGVQRAIDIMPTP